MKLFYLSHSAFALTTEKTALIFDYPVEYQIEKGFDEGYVKADELKGFEHVYFLTSHVHGDHFKKSIFEYAAANVKYIVDSEIRTPIDAIKMSPYETYSDDVLTVKTFGSTDMGISFLIELEGKRIFHAGDLNCWHWVNENDDFHEKEARDAFAKEMKILTPAVSDCDLAMFPVDDRMQGSYDDGAVFFMETIHPKLFVPMHFWGKHDVAAAFAKKYANVFAAKHPGDFIVF